MGSRPERRQRAPPNVKHVACQNQILSQEGGGAWAWLRDQPGIRLFPYVKRHGLRASDSVKIYMDGKGELYITHEHSGGSSLPGPSGVHVANAVVQPGTPGSGRLVGPSGDHDANTVVPPSAPGSGRLHCSKRSLPSLTSHGPSCSLFLPLSQWPCLLFHPPDIGLICYSAFFDRQGFPPQP